MRRWARTTLASMSVVAVAACSSSGGDVRSERVDDAEGVVPTVSVPAPVGTEDGPTSQTDESTESTSPDPTSAPDPTPAPATVPATVPPTVPPSSTTTVPPTSAPDTVADDPVGGDRPPSTDIDDDLFPTLGSADVDVRNYLVRLDIDATGRSFAAEIEIDATVAADITALPLDSVGIDVDEVMIDGEAATFDTTDTELLIDLPDGHGTDVTALISYDLMPDATAAVALDAGWFPSPDDSYVINEPDGSRTWMPSNDHPTDKASWRFELTVPPGVAAIANGALVSRPGPDGTGPWVWQQDEPMPTYLVQLIVGDYEVVEAPPVTSIDGDLIPITNVVPTGQVTTFQPAFDSIAEQMTYFEERFGPYPLDRYGLAFVNDLSNAAMETQGRSLFGAADFESGNLGYFQQLLLAHELAHQWFGNAVSPAEWSDLWLNESFASYLQWLWLDEIGIQPLDDYAVAMLGQRQAPGEPTGTPSVRDLFGFTRYDGGAVVLHALRLEIGDDAFFALLTAWIEENSGTSQPTEAFIEMAERFHGADLTAFFDDWLFASVLPVTYP